MPKYRVQLKQGSRTIVNHIEAKTVNDCLTFFNTLSTMQVSEILEVKYTDETLQPIDDLAYYPMAKMFAYNEASGKSKQVLIHNVKLSKNEADIDLAIKQHLEIDTLTVNSTLCGLFKSQIT